MVHIGLPLRLLHGGHPLGMYRERVRGGIALKGGVAFCTSAARNRQRTASIVSMGYPQRVATSDRVPRRYPPSYVPPVPPAGPRAPAAGLRATRCIRLLDKDRLVDNIRLLNKSLEEDLFKIPG